MERDGRNKRGIQSTIIEQSLVFDVAPWWQGDVSKLQFAIKLPFRSIMEAIRQFGSQIDLHLFPLGSGPGLA